MTRLPSRPSSSAQADDPVPSSLSVSDGTLGARTGVTGCPAFAGHDASSNISISEARRRLAQSFRRAGLDTPDLDARVLVGHALALDHAALAAQSDRRLTDNEADAIAALAKRRLDREPVARILGAKEFWGLPLTLNADTLVPRPETETVVEAALAALAALKAPKSFGTGEARELRVADLGTGSGALLLALLTELPGARGTGTDISAGALACARANAAALGLAGRSAFVACDQGAALGGGFDLVVANPPYVAQGDIAALQPEVRDFDPHRALDGGPDGMAAYRVIAGDARRLLAPHGVLVLELGDGQPGAIASLFAAAGLQPVGEPHRDLSGVPRALAVKVLT